MIDPDDDCPPPAPPYWLSLLRLLRLPNVFTAWADILLGYWLTVPPGEFGHLPTLALLLAATSGLYLGGMVLNDLCDVSVDRKERPWRPLPAGLIGVRFAGGLAACLLLGGLVAAGFVGWKTLGIAGLLFAAIIGYNAFLKGTLLGPLAMGACRGLNVLLAMSPAFGAAEPGDEILPATFVQSSAWWTVPAAAFVYVAGLTFFAREEAVVSRRWSLAAGLAVLLAGLGLHAWGLSSWIGPEHVAWRVGGLMALFVAFRSVLAIHSPSPFRVQQAVVMGILSLCLIAATWMLAVHGRDHAVACLLLMFPALLLGRVIHGT